jgi:hypothetical protein
MKCGRWFLGMAICAGLLTGCVERRYVINSEPQGATVLRDGEYIGVTPADDHFVYYGKRKFTIIKDGYETLQVEQNIPAPWYEYPPLDFISENLNPFPIEDRREFNFTLQPRKVGDTKELLNNAQNLRNRGLSLGGGSALPPGSVGPPPIPPDANTPPP